jgi:phenylalanyl-tRNA synthetase beta chain
MKISIAWLQDWLRITDTPAVLADRLSFAGLEVSAIDPAAAELEGVVVAEVISVEQSSRRPQGQACQAPRCGELRHAVL